MLLKHFLISIIILSTAAIAYIFVNANRPSFAQPSKIIPSANTQIATTVTPPKSATPSKDYLTVLVGDSIINALGANAESLRQKLLAHYPDHEFVNYNYGYGATNILSLPERLHQETTYQGQTFAPILEVEFDLIILESFAYNPLSQYPITEGLQKHSQILSQAIADIRQARPQAVVVLMVPYAPVKEKFASTVYDLSIEQRIKWAQERVDYIEHTIKFANDHDLPLINIYEKTLTATGNGQLQYLDPGDYIHPSPAGVELIAQTIADYIHTNQIFPR